MFTFVAGDALGTAVAPVVQKPRKSPALMRVDVPVTCTAATDVPQVVLVAGLAAAFKAVPPLVGVMSNLADAAPSSTMVAAEAVWVLALPIAMYGAHIGGQSIAAYAQQKAPAFRLLDDMKRKDEAAQAYEEALRTDPAFADCCYNLALLCEELGRQRDAIRHMARYRKLRGGR